jgi:hypothetical protein
MRTTILLAAATAATFVFASVGPPAVAQGMGGPMMSPPPPQATKAPRKGTAARGYLPRSAGGKGIKGPGRCGTNMYWKAGKCVDARAPSVK